MNSAVSFLTILTHIFCCISLKDKDFPYLGPFFVPLWTPTVSPIGQLHDEMSALSLNKATFIIAMKLNNVEDLMSELLLVSDPESERYGQHYSLDEIKARFSPSESELRVVTGFFQGIKYSTVEINEQGDLIRITAQVKHIESALETKLTIHVHTGLNSDSDSVRALRAEKSLHIPDHIANKISFISLNSPVSSRSLLAAEVASRKSTTNIAKGQRQRQDQDGEVLSSADIKTMESQTDSSATTIQTIAKLYGIPQGYRERKGSQAFFSNLDLSYFLSISGLRDDVIPDGNIFGNLPNNPTRPGGEASLDVQYIMVIPTYMYSMKDLNPYSSENEGFLSYLWVVGNQTHPPLVHSMSYGDIEADVFNGNTPGAVAYGLRVELEFVKMGLRGLSVLFATGDNGIGNFRPTDTRCTRAWPDWPASSPFVTAVGATQLSTDYLPMCSLPSKPCVGEGEVVCSGGTGGVITSGGGFSDIHSRRDKAPWQQEAVDSYLKLHTDKIPHLSYFNSSGRGYPDIST
eukprot:gene10987-22952_t